MRKALAVIVVLAAAGLTGCADRPGIAIPPRAAVSGAGGGTGTIGASCNAKVRTDLPEYGVIQPADLEMPNWTAFGAVRHWPDSACLTQPDFVAVPAIDCRLAFPWLTEPAFAGHGGRIRLDAHLQVGAGTIDETVVFFAQAGAGEAAIRSAPARCAGVLLGSIDRFLVYQMPADDGAMVWVATAAGLSVRMRLVGQAGPALPYLRLALSRAADVRDPGLRERLTAGGEACLSGLRNLVCGPG